jgi:hypothetical protein
VQFCLTSCYGELDKSPREDRYQINPEPELEVPLANLLFTLHFVVTFVTGEGREEGQDHIYQENKVDHQENIIDLSLSKDDVVW